MFPRKIDRFNSVSIIALGNDHHWIALDNLSHLLSDYDVKIYSTKEYVSELDRLGCTYYKKRKLEIKEDSETKSEFLNRIKPTVEKSDVLMLETLRTEFEWFAKNKFNIPVILFIHCLNWYTFPNKRWPLYRILNHRKGFRTKLTTFNSVPSINRKNIKLRQKILMNVDALVFHDPAMVNYYYQNWKPPFHKISVMPYAYYNPELNEMINTGSIEKKTLKESLDFIVPGSIYKQRRDYEFILSSFKEVMKYSDKCINLRFPGPLLKYEPEYGRSLKKIFDQTNKFNSKLKIYYNYSSETEPRLTYDEQMLMSDVIISQMPVDGNKMFKYYHERYCETTSCHYGDLLRFAKPGIFPSSFVTKPEISSIVSIYSNQDEFTNIILKYTDKEYLESQKIKAEILCKSKFSSKPIMKRFLHDLFNS